MIRESKNQKVDFKMMSKKRCRECSAPLKLNVVNRNPHACLCYVCFKLSKGKLESTVSKVMNGEKVVVRKIDYKKSQLQNIRKYR